MENKKEVTPNDRPDSRSRQKTAKQFLDSTKSALLTKYSSKEQNDIVKELYFAVRENRAMEIDGLKATMENLVKLNEEIPVGE